MRIQITLLAPMLFALSATSANAQVNFSHVFDTLTGLAADQDSETVGESVEIEAPAASQRQERPAPPSQNESAETTQQELNPPPLPPAPPASEAASIPSVDVYRDTRADGAVASHGYPPVYSTNGCDPWGCGGFSPQPLTLMQIFAPPCGTEGLWDSYPAEYYERCEKQRAKRYPKPEDCWEGCNSAGIYYGPQPLPHATSKPCDDVAKKTQANQSGLR